MAKQRDSNGNRQGTIVRVVRDRGFGFVRDGDGKEYFFHASCLPLGVFAELAIGDSVTFVIGDGAKGPRAESMELL